MPKKLPPIWELEFNFNQYVELHFAHDYAPNYKKDEKLADKIREFKKHHALAKKWKSVAVLREDSGKADFVAVDSARFAVSEKAKKVLEKEYSSILEFLPLHVVGKLVEVDYEFEVKPIRKKETFYFLNPTAKMTLGKKTRSSKYPACLDYMFCEFDEQEIENTPIFRLPQAMPIMVTSHFKKLVETKKLKGLKFENQKKMDWVAAPSSSPGANKDTKGKKAKSATSKPTKSKAKKSSKKVETAEPKLVEIATPKSIESLCRGPYKKMTKKLWDALLESWNWSCDVAKDRETEKPMRPKIAKPMSKTQLEKLRKKVGHNLPAEFEHVLLNFSREADFFWSIFESADEVFDGDGELITLLKTPEQFKGSLYGGGTLWDIKMISRSADDARAQPLFADWVKFKEGIRIARSCISVTTMNATTTFALVQTLLISLPTGRL